MNKANKAWLAPRERQIRHGWHHENTTHRVLSNRESGHGRYDTAIIPKNNINDTAVFLEFKATKDVNIELHKLATQALAQIHNKDYTAEIDTKTIRKIVRIGLAFRGKTVAMDFDEIDC